MVERSLRMRKVRGSTPRISNFFKAVASMRNTVNILFLWLGSVAEWSKALVLGTSLYGGVGSNPTTAILFY